MRYTLSLSAKEARLLSLKVTRNLSHIVADTAKRYIQTPVETGHPERLLMGAPLAIINGTGRAIDGILAGLADQEIDVPDGSFAETRRDVTLATKHLIPPRPLKLATDIIRLPGTLTTGFFDAAGGFDTRGRVGRLLAESAETRLN